MPTTDALKLRHSDCFKLLAACFYEPDQELFLQEQLCDNLVFLLSACGYGSAAEAARDMLVALSELSDEEMKVEHARLFVGPFELVAPPYGSVYLEKGGMLMGDSTLAVQKMYQGAGLSLDVMEAPDHIALELEFMHYLCLEEYMAEARGQHEESLAFAKRQAEFMSRFLAPWIPVFCDNIRQGSGNHFYVHLADCLEIFTLEMISFYQSVPTKRKD